MTTHVYLLAPDCTPLHDLVEVTPEVVRLKSASYVAAIYCVTEAHLHVSASLAAMERNPNLGSLLPPGSVESLTFLVKQLGDLMDSSHLEPGEEIVLAHEDAALVFSCFGLCSAMGEGHRTAENLLAALEHVILCGDQEDMVAFSEIMLNLEQTIFGFLGG